MNGVILCTMQQPRVRNRRHAEIVYCRWHSHQQKNKYVMWNEKTTLRSDSKIPGKLP